MHQWRYLTVVGVAVGVTAVHAWQGQWAGDFWEHAAVVRTLALDPWRPPHPQLAIDAPHAFESPYLLALALVARLAGSSPVSVLAVAGIANVAILAWGLARLLTRLLPNGGAACVYAWLFLLFFWGREPWYWSGFLHVSVLGYVAPYPATFATAIALLTLSLVLDVLADPSTWRLAGISFLSAACVLVHPTTAAVLLASITALYLSRVREHPLERGAKLALAIAAGGFLAMLWPYFSVLDLLLHQSGEFHVASRALYSAPHLRAWPAVILLPLTLWRVRHDRRDPVVLLVAASLALYVLGGASAAYGLGRAIAWVVLFVHVGAASAAASLEASLPRRRAALVPAAAVAVVALFAVSEPAALHRLLHPSPQKWPAIAAALAPVDTHEVVLADGPISWMIPAFTGKVVASMHPLYWVPDHRERRNAIADFFRAGVSDQLRGGILERYRVKWLLLDESTLNLTAPERSRLLQLGRTVTRTGPFILMAIGEKMLEP